MATGLGIEVCAATGTGSTPLSAFDDALQRAGLHEANLVRLSSVIPPQARVDVVGSTTPAGGVGDRAYCVWALETAQSPGEQAWAGLGWATASDGRGVFVEHGGTSEAQVRAQLETSLHELGRRRGLTVHDPRYEVVGTTCEDSVSAALVIAAYGSEPWPRG